MGVADGVYSWREMGIDSGHLAQALMRTASHMAKAGVEDVFKGEVRVRCLLLSTCGRSNSTSGASLASLFSSDVCSAPDKHEIRSIRGHAGFHYHLHADNK